MRSGSGASGGQLRPAIWPVRFVIGLAALSLVAAVVDVHLDGQWDGPPAELAVRVLEEPDRDIRWLTLEYRSPLSSLVARAVRPLGSREVAAAVVVGLALYGWLRRRPAATRLAADVLLASLLSAAVAFSIQLAVGRSRPGAEEGVAAFHGPTLSRPARSFPSGHATQAFALATVIGEAVPSPVVRVAAQGLAALVAFSRVHDDRHFYSDVVAGALIGSATGWFVIRRRRRNAPRAAADTAVREPRT